MVTRTFEGKTALAIRVDKLEAESLKEIAKASDKSVTCVMLDGQKLKPWTWICKSKLQTCNDKSQNWARHESATGRKLQTQKKVSIPLTEQEHYALKVIAADRNTPMGLLLRQELEQGYLPDVRGNRPALEAV